MIKWRGITMQHGKILFVLSAIFIAATSLVFSHYLVHDLTSQEHQSMEVWAEAMRSLQRADEKTDLGLVLKIINGNNTIPVVVIDEEHHVLAARNLRWSQDSIDKVVSTVGIKHPLKDELLQQAEQFIKNGQVITLNLASDSFNNFSLSTIYVCFSPSIMLRRLSVFPYVQLGVVGLFVAVAILALLSSKRAEQNNVWVGLSRETAHQLGTPLSSLIAATEILQETYPHDPFLKEMDKDVQRLQLVAERFSKIGSASALVLTDIVSVVNAVVDYMSHRVSGRVQFSTNFTLSSAFIPLNAPLFEWVIENLCKNAVDAMSGKGKIHIDVSESEKNVFINVSDTGIGIPSKQFKRIFNPGFTTKQRGWGLGLSLAKRIVEEYHKGKIFVAFSEVNKGTTFRIILRKPK